MTILFIILIILIISLLFDGYSMFYLTIILLIILFVYFNKNRILSIKDIWTNHPEVDIRLDKLPEKIFKQVFNIPEQKYNYNDAQTICKAFDAKLATVDQMDDAYKSGADWCNMGWSDNQLGLFPTQESSYNKLQSIPGHERDCGIPGVNGGYISSTDTKLGVNCYGIKPKMNDVEKDIMNNVPFYPMTKEEQEMDKKVDFWKEHLDQIILSPFSHDSWSKL